MFKLSNINHVTRLCTTPFSYKNERLVEEPYGENLLHPAISCHAAAMENSAVSDSVIWKSPAVVAHSSYILKSLRRWTGRELLASVGDPIELSRRLFEAPFVLVAHGTEKDPVLNYGNRMALRLWEMPWQNFTQTPSRFTAELPNREERVRLLRAVTENGFIDNYSGVRISSKGRRFRITKAVVWNLIADDGSPCGQAAMFDQWEFL